MATITRQAPVLPAPPGRAGFGGTLRSEFTKIGSVRSTYWTLLMLFAVSVGIGAAISAVVAGGWSQPPPPPPAPPDIYEATQVSLAGMLVLGQLVIVVPGVLTAEYSTGMIRTSLIAMPRRIVLYVAKAVAFAAVALAVSLVTAFTAFFLGQALLASSHHSATLAEPGVLRAVIGSALYLTLCGLFAFAAAAIIRNTAAAITAMIGLLFVLPVLVNLLPWAWRDDLVRWLPSSTARAISATVGRQDPHLFPPWGQFAVFAVCTAVLLVAGGILFRKRDA